MHFRVRKNVIQLIRTSYDKNKKKGSNTIVATVRLPKPELSEDLRSSLSVDEISAFEAWINTQHRKQMLREEMAALTLAETIELAEKWFDREAESNTAQSLAHDIVFQWQSMRKLLAKKGLL